jgi:protein-L-isoaspartate(D-aspartate) O-methyltransferase
MSATAWRRFFAEEIEIVAGLTSAALVDALATVPRERFLPSGPWTIRGEGDFQKPARLTRDADPRGISHNVSVAIDPDRMLFNGAPGVVASAIDALAVGPGARVLHIGTGLGYYTAILAHVVGPTGRVVGLEVDPVLANEARRNLADVPWVDLRHGDGTEPLAERVDAILVNAGVTHPLAAWLDALASGGRLMLPITAAMAPMPIGKGPMVLLTRTDRPDRLAARVAGFVTIYSALGVRDEAVQTLLGQALARAPFAAIQSWRRDPHEPGASCWLHTAEGCLSLEPAI